MSSLEEERDELRRAKRATEEMLFLVLDAVGEPVQVEAATMADKVSQGDKTISITLDDDGLYWTFCVEDVPSE